MAASTSRTGVRIRDRRDLLTAVRRAILRVALRADLVLAIRSSCARDRDCGRPDDKNAYGGDQPPPLWPGFYRPLAAPSTADVVAGERRHVHEISVLGGQADDLYRPVKADQQRPDHVGTAEFLQHFG